MTFTLLLKEFLNELRLAKGRNCLIFVILDRLPHIMEDTVRENGIEIYTTTLHKEDNLFKLVDILLKWDETRDNVVYFVYGIMSQAPEILSYLNLHRDFLYDIKRPIVILGSRYDINEISTFAPDLWRFRSRTYDFSKKEKEILPEYVLRPPVSFFRVREVPSLPSWSEEELKRRIDLDEHLLETIKDGYRRSELHESLVTYYFALDNVEKSDENLTEFRRLREDKKDLSEVYKMLGDVCFSKKKLKEAVEYYSRAIELNPEYEDAYNNRGNVYSELDQFEKAILDFNKAIEIELDHSFVLAYSNRGLAYYNLSQFEKAIADCNKAVELDPAYAYGYNLRGIAYYRLNQFEKAIADCNKAIELNSAYTSAYNNRGLIYYGLNQFEKAIADFTKAIELDPDFALAYNNRGFMYHGLNQFEKAIADFTKAIELDPDFAWPYDNRGDSYSMLKRFDEAIKDYSKVIELDSKNAEAFYKRGLVYSESKRCSEAIKDYTKAIEINSEDANAYEKRGIAYSITGNHEKAVKDFREAGILFLRSMRVEESIKILSMCFDLKQKIENDDVIYCGLMLYLLTLDDNVLIKLKELNIKDESLKKIFEITIKKLDGRDISGDIEKIERNKEIDMLLKMLEEFKS